MSSNQVAAALDSLDAAFDELAALPLDALTDPERLAGRTGWKPIAAASPPSSTG